MKLLKVGLVALAVTWLFTLPTLSAQEEPIETAVEQMPPSVGPAATERRVGELRRHVRDDIARGNWDRARRNLAELVSIRKFDSDFQLTLGLVFRQMIADFMTIRDDPLDKVFISFHTIRD